MLRTIDPQVAAAINAELERQNLQVELIASENFVSQAVLEAQGSVMTNKYAEGYPGKRYYGGCANVDIVENLARERAKKLFGCDHVNVQPHAGSQANMAAYFSVLKAGDPVMGLALNSGGHLTHGHPVNFSGSVFRSVQYGLDTETELIDYDRVLEIAHEHRPKLIVTGTTAYPRVIDFEKFRKICDEVGALLMVDIAHIAGLVATGLHPSPVPMAEIVTSTTHKTLRGPRAGMIMCKQEYAQAVDKAVFPMLQGGPLMHAIAAKAVAFEEALRPSFKTYCAQIIKNAHAMADVFLERGFRLVTGGTDNHLMVMDLQSKNLSGKEAEHLLEGINVTVNKNSVPNDPKPPMVTSGIRIGTPAMTTRGFKEQEMAQIAQYMSDVLDKPHDALLRESIRKKVIDLCKQFPLYKDLHH